MHAALDDHRAASPLVVSPHRTEAVAPGWKNRSHDIPRRTKETTMTTMDAMFEEREVLTEAAGKWWLFLLSGIAWLVFSLIIFRFDITSVTSIGILFGIIAIMAGLNELMTIPVSTTGWKIAHGALGVIFVVVGIFALIEPGEAFAALASVIGFFFLFKGIFDITLAISTRGTFDLWWLQLVAGLLEVGLAFWVAGSFRDKVILLVVYTGLAALSRGISELFLAFKLKGVQRELQAG
jgi:uncharacterized membrane protein HdeD (DUF308 family)